MERYADNQDEEISGKNSIVIIGHRCKNRCPVFMWGAGLEVFVEEEIIVATGGASNARMH